MEISLDGKVALVTGASKGIGKAIAASMAASGAKVMINSRKQDQLEAAAAEMDGEVEIFAANAGDADAGERAVAATLERFGQLDILVNNAATNPYYGRLLEVDEGRYDKTFQVNLKAPVWWSKAAWEQAFKERPGTIINIASVGGLRTEGGGLGVYNLTKAALIHLTRQLASELGPTRVVGIAPGSSPPTSLRSWWRTSAISWLHACRCGGSVNPRTSPTSRRSSPATSPAGSPARPTSSTVAPASLRGTDVAGADRRCRPETELR